MTDEATTPAPSDYEQVGGAPAVTQVVDRFYELVLADPDLSGFFADTDLPRLKRHQVLLVSQVLGGPANYDGRDLRTAHASLDIESTHFDSVVAHLVTALKEAGVPDEIIGRAGAVVVGTKDDVVGADAR